MKRSEFIKTFGEAPEDILGNDWKNEIEYFVGEGSGENPTFSKSSNGRDVVWNGRTSG